MKSESETFGNMELFRTTSENQDFVKLVIQLDAYLKIVDGDDHAFYAAYNKTDTLKYVIVAYENNEAVGCGALREFDAQAIEIKRMYVPPANRNKGIAKKVLLELETWSKELGFKKCILETGKKQLDAVALYTKNGYNAIPNYGQYENIETSVCFEKKLI